jgi:hypothetical protein
LSVEPEWNGIIKAIENGLKKGSISFTTEVSAASLIKFNQSLQAKKTIKITISRIDIEI